MSETIVIPNLFSDPARADRPALQTPAPLPTTPAEVTERGWKEVDVVFVTGDAYVDHPSFAAGLLARVLEADGFRVAILSQPDWNSADDFRKFGRPRLAFCVSAGNMDSMLNHYTANRKVRNDDAYSPGGEIGRRPDRATLAYCQRAREAFPGVPIIAGGVEASLRRVAHYDYWSDKVRRSILLDAKADLLSYGMGERALLEILRRLNAGEPISTIRDVRGTVYRLGRNEDLPEESPTLIHLPSFEEIDKDTPKGKLHFVKTTQLLFENLNPFNAKTLVQEHGDEAVVVNPPAFPLSEAEMDAIYGLPFTRKAHPSYDKPIPALEVVRASVQTHRGCYGGCAFCSITAHQGKFIQSRSENSILNEIETLARDAGGDYVVNDLSAPTANMYKTGGKVRAACEKCARTSCLCPDICPNLNPDQGPTTELLKRARQVEGVKSVLVASGIRTDLANFSPAFVEELAAHHTGGHLKTAPEHVDDEVLALMNKPPIADYERFCDLFASISDKIGKEQYLVPYLISGFPGCTLKAMVSVAEYLKANEIRPEQVQDFVPAPMQLATCAYYTGIDPITEERIYVPRGLRERRLQRALLMYYNPEYYHDVKSALKEARREDLIGNEPTSLIPPYPPKALSLRQSSRVKRLKRKQEREKLEKERRREEFERAESEKKSARGGKRVGRERSGRGGYRSSAREYGRERKVWGADDRRRESGFKRNDGERDSFRRDDSERAERPSFRREDAERRPFRRDFNDDREFNGNNDDERRFERRERSDFRRNDGERTERRSFRRDDSERSERGGFKREGFRRNDAPRGDFRRDDSERGSFRRDFNDKRKFNGNNGGERRFERRDRDGGFRRDDSERSERGGFKSERSERGGFKREGFRRNGGDGPRGGGFKRRRDD